MSRITITIDTPDTLDTKDFVFEVDDALNMGFKHEFYMWTIEPKRGRWIRRPYDYHDNTYECSVCGEPWTFMDGTPEDNGANYCPNCGARME